MSNEKAVILALKEANVALHDRILALESWGVPNYHRICLNCGRKLNKDTKRTDEPCKHPGDEFAACTFDMTYMELVEELKARDKEINTLRGIVEGYAKSFDHATNDGIQKSGKTH